MAVLTRSDIVDGYIIQSLIKSNLYTETYRVVDNDGNPFFLKLFLPLKMPSKLINNNTGIVREIEYSQRLNHRNVISHIVHGKIERKEGSFQYYITNYFNGVVLADVLAQHGAFDETRALCIFRKLLNALAYLHSQVPTLCHNDLDTSNIILLDSSNEEPVIIDLGHLSERCGGAIAFDTSDLDPRFHAHETIANIFDEQGDVFSICAVLYTMLTGKVPWDIEYDSKQTYKERITFLSQYRKANPLDLSELGVSDKTKFILQKGLQLKSHDRFNDIQALLNVLESSDFEDKTKPNFGDGRKDSANTSSQSGHEDVNPVDFQIKRGGGNGFKDIAGMHDLKDSLSKQVIFVIKDKETADKYRITPPNGMLLYGPPGCGKTFFAEKFAEETNFNFLLIKASDLGSSFIHGSQEKISKLFKLAEKNTPIVLCFDEFDALVPDRSAFGAQYQAGEVNEFLSQMNNCSKRGIFIVATSNRPDKIDPAVLRTGRIDKMVYVPLPDRAARKEMFELYLANRPVKEDIDTDLLAERTKGYIASDIAFIVNDAAMTAAYSRALITNELLQTSLKNNKPSLRKEALDAYEQIRDRMEDRNRANNIRTIVDGL